MSAKLCSLSLLLALTLQISLVLGKHLLEKPDFLRPCDFNDPNLNTCFASNFQVLFREWKDGIPGLKSLGSLEPLAIKRIKIDQTSPLQLNAEIENMLVHGASGTKVLEASLDRNTLDVLAKIEIPELRATSNYKAKGSILGLNFNGQGTASFRARNIVLAFHIKTRLRREGDIVFSEILGLKAKIENIGDFHIQVDNLFPGQPELESTANDIFNQNWRDLLEFLKPTLVPTLEYVMKDRFSKIYSFVPANYFITNLP